MSRIPRLGQFTLGTPGLDASPPVVSNVAEQVRDVLAAAGQSAFIVGRNARIASAEEDEQNRGAAHLRAQSDLAPLSEQIENEVLDRAAAGGDLSDDALRSLVESKIGTGLSGLTVNEAGVQQYRTSLTDNLTAAAFGARSKAVDHAQAESWVDAASAFSTVTSADDYERVAGNLRTINPRASDFDIRAAAVPALQTAAKTGNRRMVEVLASKIGDTPETQEARWTLDRVERQFEEDAATERVKAADEAFDSFMRTNNFIGAKAVVDGSNIPASAKRRMEDHIRAVREERHRARRALELGSLGSTLTRLSAAGDVDGFKRATDSARSSGLIGDDDVAAFNRDYGIQLSRDFQSKSQVAINQFKNATSDTERTAALQSVADIVTAADAALARKPGEVGRIEQDQYAEIMRISEPVLNQIQDLDYRHQELLRLLSESESVGGVRLQDTKLASGNWSADEKGRELANVKWQMISATDAAPQDKLKDMVSWLGQNRGTVWTEAESRYQGFIGRAINAVKNPDKPEILEAVKADLRDLAVMYQANADVARRHVPENAQELLDFTSLIGDLIPLNDNEAIGGALANIVNRDGPVNPYSLTAPDKKKIDDALAGKGYDNDIGNIIQIRQEAYAKAQALANVFPSNMDQIASRVSEYYQSSWKHSDGWAIRVGDVKLAEQINYDIASKAAKGVWRKSHNSNAALVLRQDAVGRWRLFERNSLVPVEDSPSWGREDLLRISDAYTYAAKTIADKKGLEKATLSQAFENMDDQVEVPMHGAELAGAAGLGNVFWDSISRMTSSRILENRHARWRETFIEQNKRGRDEYEQFVLEMFSQKNNANTTGAMTSGH